jgi:hypothetical protein
LALKEALLISKQMVFGILKKRKKNVSLIHCNLATNQDLLPKSNSSTICPK